MGPLGMHHAAHSPTYKEPDEGFSREVQRLAKRDGITIEEAIEKAQGSRVRLPGRGSQAEFQGALCHRCPPRGQDARAHGEGEEEATRGHHQTLQGAGANEYLLIGDVEKSRLYKIKQLKLLEDGPEQVASSVRSGFSLRQHKLRGGSRPAIVRERHELDLRQRRSKFAGCIFQPEIEHDVSRVEHSNTWL
eukprot:499833-Pleurochrysis_carterae.AAC.2